MEFHKPFRFSFADAVILKEDLHAVGIGTVTTGEPESDVEVTLRRDGDTFVFDFVIPRGRDGDRIKPDTAISDISQNAVENRIIKAYVDEAILQLRHHLEDNPAQAQCVTVEGTGATEAAMDDEIRAYAMSMEAGNFRFEYIPANYSHSKFGGRPFLVEGYKSSKGDIFLEAVSFVGPLTTQKFAMHCSAEIGHFWGQWATVVQGTN